MIKLGKTYPYSAERFRVCPRMRISRHLASLGVALSLATFANAAVGEEWGAGAADGFGNSSIRVFGTKSRAKLYQCNSRRRSTRVDDKLFASSREG